MAEFLKINGDDEGDSVTRRDHDGIITKRHLDDRPDTGGDLLLSQGQA
jgi:hypothetical protein